MSKSKATPVESADAYHVTVLLGHLGYFLPVRCSGPTPEQAKARAETVTRRWNAAPAMLEALSELTAWVVQLSEQSDENALDWLNRLRNGHDDEFVNARAALALARGE